MYLDLLMLLLLHRKHRHVSATHETIFRVMRTRIQMQSCVEITTQCE